MGESDVKFHSRRPRIQKDFPGRSLLIQQVSLFTFLGFFISKIEFQESRTLKCFLLNKTKILNSQILTPKFFLLLRFNKFILLQHENFIIDLILPCSHQYALNTLVFKPHYPGWYPLNAYGIEHLQCV